MFLNRYKVLVILQTCATLHESSLKIHRCHYSYIYLLAPLRFTCILLFGSYNISYTTNAFINEDSMIIVSLINLFLNTNRSTEVNRSEPIMSLHKIFFEFELCNNTIYYGILYDVPHNTQVSEW